MTKLRGWWRAGFQLFSTIWRLHEPHLTPCHKDPILVSEPFYFMWSRKMTWLFSYYFLYFIFYLIFTSTVFYSMPITIKVAYYLSLFSFIRTLAHDKTLSATFPLLLNSIHSRITSIQQTLPTWTPELTNKAVSGLCSPESHVCEHCLVKQQLNLNHVLPAQTLGIVMEYIS